MQAVHVQSVCKVFLTGNSLCVHAGTCALREWSADFPSADTNLHSQEHGRDEASAGCHKPWLKGWGCFWVGAARGWVINRTPYAGGATALPMNCPDRLPGLWPPLLLLWFMYGIKSARHATTAGISWLGPCSCLFTTLQSRNSPALQETTKTVH